MLRTLDELRGEIRDRLASASPTDPDAPFSVRVAPEIGGSIERAVNDWRRLTGQDLRSGIDLGLDIGGTATATALNSAGLSVVAPAVSPDLLSVLARPTASILSEMGESMAQQIEREVRLSAAGLNSASQATRNIERLLTTSTEVRRGLRRHIGFAYQAEAIARTEIGRAFSVAQSNANIQLSKSVPGLKKKWVTVGDGRTRRGHRDAEARYAEGANPGPIPVSERYRVVDFSRTGTSEFLTFRGRTGGRRVARVDPFRRQGRLQTQLLMHPLDPFAGPGFVVNCRCVSMEVVPDFEKALEDALGIVQEALREAAPWPGSC